MRGLKELFLNGLAGALGIESMAGMLIITILAAVPAYLLGSINSAIIVSKLLHKEDIRDFGSHNAGMTNMLRTYGKKEAALTLLGDVLKAVISVFLGIFAGVATADGVVSVSGYVCAVFCMLGHIFPCWYGFRGGKGVLVAATSILCLTPPVFLVLVIIFLVMVFATKYISVGSITAAFFYPLVVRYMVSPDIFSVTFSLLICIIVIICHKDNIKRLRDKKENKLNFTVFKRKDR